MEVRNRVRGVAHDKNVAKITVVGVPDRPGIAAALFEPLAQQGISVDTIVQNSSVERIADLTFTVTRADLAAALDIIRPVAQSIGAQGFRQRQQPCQGEHRWHGDAEPSRLRGPDVPRPVRSQREH